MGFAVWLMWSVTNAKIQQTHDNDPSVYYFKDFAGEYKGVSESIVPLVKASVNKPVDVVVVRLGDGQVKHVALTLTPQQWSGAGLLGCILK